MRICWWCLSKVRVDNVFNGGLHIMCKLFSLFYVLCWSYPSMLIFGTHLFNWLEVSAKSVLSCFIAVLGISGMGDTCDPVNSFF